MTAAERDPAWVSEKRKADADLRRAEAEDAREEAPLVKDLKAMGSTAKSVWDLVNSKKRYPELIPILLTHLGRNYSDGVREGIARALAIREARAGWKELVRAYLNESDPTKPAENVNQVKWDLHLAIAAAADDSVIEELIDLAIDKHHAYHRSQFVESLARLKGMRAQATLEELEEEPDLKDAFERLEKKKKQALRRRK